MAKTKCEYGGGCVYCLYVDTCTHPAKESLDGIYRNETIRLSINKENLDNMAQKRYLSIAEIERRIERHRNYISSRLGAGTRFPLEVVEEIAKILKCSIWELLEPEQELEVRFVDWNIIEKEMAKKKVFGNQIAFKAGKSNAYFGAVKSGAVLPKPEFLDIICDMLELPKDEVYEMQVLE